MKQDAETGLWVPDEYQSPSPPVFPPRLTIPSDTRHVRSIDGISRDRGMNANTTWDGWTPPKPQAEAAQ